MTTLPRSLTPAEAMSILGCSRSKLAAINHQLRPFRDPGGHRRYDLADVLAWRERRRERFVTGNYENKCVEDWVRGACG